jgi:ubiquitin-conjugating enzyme E2 C
MKLMMSGSKDVSAFPEEENVFQWAGSIRGSAGTAYEGCTFKLRMVFPADYPFTAPKVTFTTPCWHPNVDAAGNICLDILKDKWTAAYSALTILLSLQTLLGDPNNDSPLNGQAASAWADQAEFRRTVVRKYRECTGASPTSGPLE